MEVGFLAKGVILGFSIAAPVGPLGVLCIRRTLAEGRAAGLATGLGVACGDAVYGSIAAFGLTFISDFLLNQQIWIRLIGGGFLCYLGVRTYLSPVQRSLSVSDPAETGVIRSRRLAGAIISAFGLTITNPATILSFAAMFAGLGLGTGSNEYGSAGVLVYGVFLGSACWWLLLSSGISLFRARFDAQTLGWINKLSGIIIAGFGLIALVSVVRR